MTTPTNQQRPAQLPTESQLADALKRLEYIWNLVSASARPIPQHKRVKEDLHKIIARCLNFVQQHGTQLAALSARQVVEGAGVEAEGSGDVLEQSPLSIVMGIMRTLDEEQILQVKVLLMMRELSDGGRVELFEEIQDSHHVACGGELYEDVPHECEADDEGDGDGDEDAAEAVSAPALEPPVTNGSAEAR